jgi:hypothetical protein
MDRMKLFLKTVGWAIISGTIFFVSAIANSCPWEAALIATLIATASKTPAYPAWEVAFAWLWNRGCTKVVVDKTPVLVGETA